MDAMWRCFKGGDTEMEWKPSPGCKVLFENLPLWYLIGNTRGKNLLEGSTGECPSAKSLLLLGCGDIRNVFFTVAAQANALPLTRDGRAGDRKGKQGATKTSVTNRAATEARSCHLEFHLNDWNPVVLARAVLFLTLARNLDVLLVEDMDFFWSLWCHLALTPRQLSRLQETSAALAATDFYHGSSDIVISNEEDVATLKSIWKSWALCKDIPSVVRVVAMRKEKMEKHFNMTPTEADSESVFHARCYASARSMCEGSFMDRKEMEDMQPVVEKEALNWNETGMTGWMDTPGTETRLLANPTLLDPVSWQWHVHYAVNPFAGFMPLPLGCLQQPVGKKAGKRTEEYPLTAACKRILREQLASFKAFSRGGGLRFHVWGSDALQLALYDLPSRRVSVEASATPDVTVTSTCFDVIDTSNLADHVGLLNLLACCTPLLKSPSSRLITGTILWSNVAPSLYSYLQRALGTPHLSILPTLLGLRLAFDLHFDPLKPVPNRISWLGAAHTNERLISWCLVDDHLSTRPPSISVSSSLSLQLQTASVSSSSSLEKSPSLCAITSALQEIAKICCKPRGWSTESEAMARRARCGLHHSSPLTLCLILWNLSNRLSPQSMPGLSWEALLGGSSSHTPSFTLTLRAMWQHLRGLRDGLPHAGYEAGLGCRQGVMVYRRKLGMDYHIGMKMCQMGTPQLRVLILECPKRLLNMMERAQIIIQALAGRVSSGYKIHIIDNIQLDTNTTELVFSLPTDHGLNKDRVLVLLASIEGMPIGGSLPLSEYEEECAPEPVWGAHHHQPFVSESICDKGEGRSNGGLQGGMEVVRVVEYGGAFECVIGIQVGAEGAVSVEGKGEERRTRCCVVKLGRVKVEVMLPWAVDLTANVSIKVMRKRGLIACTFPKAARWPLPVPNHVKMDMQSLPTIREHPFLDATMNAMFTLQENAYNKTLPAPTSPTTPTFYNLRESIQILFVRHVKEKAVMFILRKIGTSDRIEGEITILVHCVKLDPLGRLALELVYTDQQRRKAMVASGQLDDGRRLKQYVTNIHSVGALASKEYMIEVWCSTQELVMFRDLLEHNGRRMTPSVWQKKKSPSLDWTASFVVPLEPNGAVEVVGIPEEREKLLDMMLADLPGPSLSSIMSGSHGEIGKKAAEVSKATLQGGKQDNPVADSGLFKQGQEVNKVKELVESMSLRTDTQILNKERGREGIATGRKTERCALERCHVCGNSGGEMKLRRCTACYRVAYCGGVCQRNDWVRHKVDCKML